MLEKAFLEAMKHSVYQNYLKGSGLGPDSVAGRKEWTAQIKQLYIDGEEILNDLGMLKKK
jgi:hypothetical protein